MSIHKVQEEGDAAVKLGSFREQNLMKLFLKTKTKTKSQFNQNSLKAISRPSGLILESLSMGS